MFSLRVILAKYYSSNMCLNYGKQRTGNLVVDQGFEPFNETLPDDFVDSGYEIQEQQTEEKVMEKYVPEDENEDDNEEPDDMLESEGDVEPKPDSSYDEDRENDDSGPFRYRKLDPLANFARLKQYLIGRE
jgi:hypothetical protein